MENLYPCVKKVSFPMKNLILYELLQHLKLHRLQIRKYYLDALFYVIAYSALKIVRRFVPHTALRVPFRNVTDSPTFSVTHKNCPS